jgi:hypothetical protein
MGQVARNLLDPVDGFLRNASYLIHDRDRLFTRVWAEASQVEWRDDRADPGAASELQLLRGAIRQDDSNRVLRSFRDLRGAPPTLPSSPVRRALSGRALSPRDRQPTHPGATCAAYAEQRQREARPDTAGVTATAEIDGSRSRAPCRIPIGRPALPRTGSLQAPSSPLRRSVANAPSARVAQTATDYR